MFSRRMNARLNRGRVPARFGPAGPPVLAVTIVWPPEGWELTVDVERRVTGTVTRSGVPVELTGFGSATVTGNDWYLDITPDSEGPLALVATATDGDDEADDTVNVEIVPAKFYITSFEFVDRSGDNLASSQGVAVDSDGGRLWACGGEYALGENRAVYEYALSDYAFVSKGAEIASPQVPSGTSQLNGIVYYDGKLYVGWNNYSTVPRLGGIVVIDPSALSTVETLVEASNGHSEGCTIRGDEAFFQANTSADIERRDMATWTLQGTHNFNWLVADTGAWYQGGDWLENCLHLGLHGSQARPKTIDVSEWDDVAEEFTPLYRLDRPVPNASQGFTFDRYKEFAYFAERDSVANNFRIVRARIHGVPALIHQTPDATSSQRDDLVYWWQRMAWSGTEWTLPDTMGNAATVTGFDTTRVYPQPTDDGVVWIRCVGHTDRSVPLGDLFGGTAWTEITLTMKVIVWAQNSDKLLFSADAAGANNGDMRIEVDRGVNGRITFFYGNAPGTTLTATGVNYTVGVPFRVTCTLGAGGGKIYVDGTQVASNSVAGIIGGLNQACWLATNYLGSNGADCSVWDLRIYDVEKSALDVAAFTTDEADMWTD